MAVRSIAIGHLGLLSSYHCSAFGHHHQRLHLSDLEIQILHCHLPRLSSEEFGSSIAGVEPPSTGSSSCPFWRLFAAASAGCVSRWNASELFDSTLSSLSRLEMGPRSYFGS